MTSAVLLLALQLVSQNSPAVETTDGGSTIRVVKKTSDEEDRAKRLNRGAVTAPLSGVALRAAEPPRAATPIARALPSLAYAPPAPAPDPVALDLVTRAPAREGPRVLPWVTLGGSAVVAVVGAVYAAKTLDAVDALGDLEAQVKGTSVTLPDEFKDQQKAVFTNGLAATLLLSSAIAGAIASSVVLASD